MQNYFIYKNKWHSVTKQQMHTADTSRDYSFHKILPFQSDRNTQLSQKLTTTLTEGANIAQRVSLKAIFNGPDEMETSSESCGTKAMSPKLKREWTIKA